MFKFNLKRKPQECQVAVAACWFCGTCWTLDEARRLFAEYACPTCHAPLNYGDLLEGIGGAE